MPIITSLSAGPTQVVQSGFGARQECRPVLSLSPPPPCLFRSPPAGLQLRSPSVDMPSSPRRPRLGSSLGVFDLLCRLVSRDECVIPSSRRILAFDHYMIRHIWPPVWRCCLSRPPCLRGRPRLPSFNDARRTRRVHSLLPPLFRRLVEHSQPLSEFYRTSFQESFFFSDESSLPVPATARVWQSRWVKGSAQTGVNGCRLAGTFLSSSGSWHL